jgi:biopolymer transport protein ExbB/TolQ
LEARYPPLASLPNLIRSLLLEIQIDQSFDQERQMRCDQPAAKADLKAELEKFERDLKAVLAKLERDLTRNVAVVTIVAVIAVIAFGYFFLHEYLGTEVLTL